MNPLKPIEFVHSKIDKCPKLRKLVTEMHNVHHSGAVIGVRQIVRGEWQIIDAMVREARRALGEG